MNKEIRSEISIRNFLHVVFKRLRLILSVLGLFIGAALLHSIFAKPVYESTAKILLKIGRENMYIPATLSPEQVAPIITANQEEQLNSESEILRSRFLAEKVIKALGPTVVYPGLSDNKPGLLTRFDPNNNRGTVEMSPKADAINTFQKQLVVEAIKKSSVIQVSFKHHDPNMAAKVVNTLVNFYLERHLDVHQNPKSTRFFQEQTKILKDKLQQAEAGLSNFRKQNGLTTPEAERQILLKKVTDSRTALDQTLTQEAETESRVAQLISQLATTPPTISLDQEVNSNEQAIAAIQTKVAELQAREQELLGKYTEDSVAVRNVRSELTALRKTMADEQNRKYSRSRTGVNPIHQNIQSELLKAQALLKSLKAKKETQNAQLDDYQKRMQKINLMEMDFNNLQQQIEMAQRNYRLYVTKIEESNISDAMDKEKISNVSLLDPAWPSAKPVSPKVLLNMLLSVFLGTVGALGLAFLLEYMDDKFENEEDVENYLGAPVLASIPELR